MHLDLQNAAASADGDILVTTKQAAVALGGLSPETLEKWRRLGSGPAFVKLGRAVRYRLADLRAFVAGAAARSTAEVATR